MWQTALNTVLTAVVAAGVGVLVAAIKAFGNAGVQYISEKAAAVRTKAGADKWDFWLSIGKQQWGAVDEEFRISPELEKTIANKQALFAEKIKKAIPGITDDQIEQLRQAVAGEINKGKAAIVGQTQDEQGNGLVADDKAAAAADLVPQTGAQPESGNTAPNVSGAA